MSLIRSDYSHFYLHLNVTDFIGPLDAYDYLFISGAPQQIKEDYLSIINVFDPYVWAFLLASLLATTIALISINKIQEKWSNGSTKETACQSTNL